VGSSSSSSSSSSNAGNVSTSGPPTPFSFSSSSSSFSSSSSYSYYRISTVPNEGDDTIPKEDLLELDLSHNLLTETTWRVYEPMMLKRLDLRWVVVVVV